MGRERPPLDGEDGTRKREKGDKEGELEDGRGREEETERVGKEKEGKEKGGVKRMKEMRTSLLEMVFGMDVRSLAVMRVGLAVIIILDLCVCT